MSNQSQASDSTGSEPKKSLFWYRVRFLALVGVFLSPFIAGWLALYVFEIRPDSNNYGTLVQPVKKLDWASFKGKNGQVYENGFGKKWVSITLVDDGCTQLCQDNMLRLRQIRTLLGRDTARLQNVLISKTSLDQTVLQSLEEYPSFVVIENFSDNRFLDQFKVQESENPGAEPAVYLVDPESNLMMVFPAVFDEYRVLDDIRRLLKLSQIG